MPNSRPPQTYQAYMLRLWRDGGQAPWRASLESTADGHRWHFGSVGELICFLEEVTAKPTAVSDHPEPDNPSTVSPVA